MRRGMHVRILTQLGLLEMWMVPRLGGAGVGTRSTDEVSQARSRESPESGCRFT